MTFFRNSLKLPIYLTLLLLFLTGCTDKSPSITKIDDSEPPDVFALNQELGRGVNLGNALEAPEEGAWGVTLQESYFDSIRAAGFQSVRIPIRWSAHLTDSPVIQIDPHFWARIDWAVHQALSRDLLVIINVHHYEELYASPETEEAKLLEIWRQISLHFKDRSPQLLFELLNEPHDQLTSDKWNRLIPRLLATVRESNPNRAVLIGPANWNSLAALPALELPANDNFLILTFHYYEPFHFTHQGAEWVEGSNQWLGTRWTGTPQQVATIQQDFDLVARWAAKNNVPVNLGEFGSYSKAPYSDRVLWTETVAREAERRRFSWCYWEFCAGFGIYDAERRIWRKELLDALLPADGF